MVVIAPSSIGLGMACLVLLHTPDGHHFSVRAEAIQIIKPVETYQHDHLAPHTHSLVYIGGRYQGIRETEEQVIKLRVKCGYGASP